MVNSTWGIADVIGDMPGKEKAKSLIKIVTQKHGSNIVMIPFMNGVGSNDFVCTTWICFLDFFLPLKDA